MADLIGIGYPDESTADEAAAEAGTVLKTPQSTADEQQLQEALPGQRAAAQ
jgi:uncharacterized membrane protein